MFKKLFIIAIFTIMVSQSLANDVEDPVNKLIAEFFLNPNENPGETHSCEKRLLFEMLRAIKKLTEEEEELDSIEEQGKCDIWYPLQKMRARYKLFWAKADHSRFAANHTINPKHAHALIRLEEILLSIENLKERRKYMDRVFSDCKISLEAYAPLNYRIETFFQKIFSKSLKIIGAAPDLPGTALGYVLGKAGERDQYYRTLSAEKIEEQSLEQALFGRDQSGW